MPFKNSTNFFARAVIFLLVSGVLFFTMPLLAAPVLPAINTNNVVVITNSTFGAVGDGLTDNTLAIANAIVAAAKGGKTNSLFGGTVEIPAPGIFLCGPLTLANNVNFQIDGGAILRLLPYSQYPGGIVNPPTFLAGTSLTNIEISGAGAIDGQGGPWWPGYNTNSRPTTIVLSKCSIVLLQNFTISNTPAQNIAIKGAGGNVTVQGITESAPDSAAAVPSHNTDGIDLAETNCLVQNCNISVGDDNIAIGSSAGLAWNILVTNCTFGYGHGVSIGSYTYSGVSNLTVMNCTFNLTQNGIRIKSDDDTKRGGLVQNILYANIGMTNVNFPFQVYSYYNEVGTPSGISPFYAATQTVADVSVFTNTPIYRNLTFSNITATAVSNYPVGIIWARTEMPATNIVFNKVTVTGDRNFCLYNVSGAQFIDCNIGVTATSNTFALFNAQVIATNSVPTNRLFTFDGITTNGYGNSLAFYNAKASLFNTNVLDDGPLTLNASTLTVSNNLTLFPTTVINFSPGTNAAQLAVVGNLTLGGTNNIVAGNGFTNGIYALMTYTGALNGTLPVLGTAPPGYNYTIYNSSAGGQINLAVTLLAPTNLVATGTNLQINLKWNAVSGATSYNLKRGNTSGNYPTIFSGLTTTNYADASVTNAVNYFYVVSAVGAGGESSNSVPASAVPLPSNQPTNILAQLAGNQLQLSWPSDHLGWRLQIQTNNLSGGLGTNWATVANSTNVNQAGVVINPTNGAVFLRLIYP